MPPVPRLHQVIANHSDIILPGINRRLDFDIPGHIPHQAVRTIPESQLQISVQQPVQGVITHSVLVQSLFTLTSHTGLPGRDVRPHHSLPVPQRHINMRRHVQSMRRIGRHLRIAIRRAPRQMRVKGIVVGMYRVVQGPGMPRVLVQHRSRDPGTPLISLVIPAYSHRPQYRQGVKGRHLLVFRKTLVKSRHPIAVRQVPLMLVSLAVQQLHCLHQSPLHFVVTTGLPLLRRRPQSRQYSPRGIRVLTPPQRMIVRHRLTPIRHSHTAVGTLRRAKSLRSIPILKTVKQQQPAVKCLPRLFRAPYVHPRIPKPDARLKRPRARFPGLNLSFATTTGPQQRRRNKYTHSSRRDIFHVKKEYRNTDQLYSHPYKLRPFREKLKFSESLSLHRERKPNSCTPLTSGTPYLFTDRRYRPNRLTNRAKKHPRQTEFAQYLYEGKCYHLEDFFITQLST